jgi:hypothetical protein
LPEPIAKVFITDELLRRVPPEADYLREKLAIQDLATQMSDSPAEVLPRLVELAMKICGAESAGISVLEPETEQFLSVCGVAIQRPASRLKLGFGAKLKKRSNVLSVNAFADCAFCKKTVCGSHVQKSAERARIARNENCQIPSVGPAG